MTKKTFITLCALLLVLSTLAILQGCKEKNGTGGAAADIDPVFRKIDSSKSGIGFANYLKEDYQRYYFDTFAYVYNGAGVATGDFNNDGLMDVYFTGNQVPNKLYLNTGSLKFKDITSSAGVDGGKGWNNGVTLVDINNDGHLDIYVCRGGFKDSESERRNLLYINKGDLTFEEQAGKYGLDDAGYSIHSAFLTWIMITIWTCILPTGQIRFISDYLEWFQENETRQTCAGISYSETIMDALLKLVSRLASIIISVMHCR